MSTLLFEKLRYEFSLYDSYARINGDTAVKRSEIRKRINGLIRKTNKPKKLT